MISSTQGFLTCLVTAFCISSIRSRWKHYLKDRIVFLLASCMATGVVVTSWFRFLTPYEIMLGISQGCWLVLAVLLASLSFPLLIKKSEQQPYLLWFPMALFFGIAGTILVSTYSSVIILTGEKILWLVLLGRGYLLQAMMLSIIIGSIPLNLESSINPKIIHGKEAIAPSCSFHIFGMLLLLISIPIEIWGHYSVGFITRLILVSIYILLPSGLMVWPGFNSPLRLCLWMAAWSFLIGYGLAACSPQLRLAGLHFVFIGGFSLGPLAFALQWLMAGNEKLRTQIDRPLSIALFGIPFIISMVLRCIPETSAMGKFFSWSLATAFFIFGVVVWMVLVKKTVSLKA